MRAQATAYIASRVSALVPATADYMDPAKKVDIEAQLKARRAWVKLYMPTETGDEHPIENYLVTVDCGAIDLATARALAEIIRAGLSGSKRNPSTFRRLRATPLDDGNYHRVQLSYQLRRPAHT